MDLDGPLNDRGLYALTPIAAQKSIRGEDVMSWNSSGTSWPSPMRVGFMSQVSPDGQYVVTTLNAGEDRYRATITLPISRTTASFRCSIRPAEFWPCIAGPTGIQNLPGADDPRYVQTDAVWSPDGKYLVFARAGRETPTRKARKMAESANDPNETADRSTISTGFRSTTAMAAGQSGSPAPRETA